MIGLIQRVKNSNVVVDGNIVGAIDHGILLLLGVQKGDSQSNADALIRKVLNYRIFADENGKMNRSVLDVNGGVLVVSQFTLAADTKKGLRPSFTSAAAPDDAIVLYEYVVAEMRKIASNVQTGEFGADMQVRLCNDGPVTFLINV